MKTGTAGDNMYRLDFVEENVGTRPQYGRQNPAAGNALLKRVCDGHRLLIDFLEHVVPKLAALDRVGGQFALAHRALNRLAISIVNRHARATDMGNIAFLEKDEPAGNRQQCRDIRGNEVLADADPDYHRRSGTRDDQLVVVLLAQNRQGVGPFQFGHRFLNGIDEHAAARKMIVNPVGNDFGIGFGFEFVPVVY